jgi:uncharacterized SAM-binding protein YcdF (DUF218 family)
VAAAVIAYGGLFVYVLAVSRQDVREPSDAIVVLGAAQYNGRPSDVLRARLDHAAALYAEGLAPLIVVTGGMAEGDVVSEATVSRQYLVAHGVDDTAVVVIPVGRNSRESVASAAEWLVDRSLASVVLVSDPFHIARLRAEANAHGLESHGSPTQTSPISTSLGAELRYLAAEAIKLPVVWATHLFGHE